MDKIGVNRERLLSEISRIHKSSFYKSREIPKMIAVSKQQENETTTIDSSHALLKSSVSHEFNIWFHFQSLIVL